jgi:hypothetical protein
MTTRELGIAAERIGVAALATENCLGCYRQQAPGFSPRPDPQLLVCHEPERKRAARL